MARSRREHQASYESIPSARCARFFKAPCWILAALAMMAVADVRADDATSDKPPATADEKNQPAAAASEFPRLLAKWKQALSEMRLIRQKFAATSELEQRAKLEDEFRSRMAEARTLIPLLRDSGRAAYAAAPNENPELTRFLFKLAKDEMIHDRYDDAWNLAELLVSEECGISEAYNVAGVAAFARNDYDKAEQYLGTARQRGVLGPVGNRFLSLIEQCRKLWGEEKQLREAQAGKLPLVQISTTKGDMTFELFEVEAPQTVGNFVHLIEEREFFDGLAFHEVIPGFRARTGCPKGDGTGGPGYKIYCECYTDNFRKHFRGSLSMETDGLRDSGGSRIFITFVPTPQLNGRNTVFGRIVDGMDVLESLQYTAARSGDTKVALDKITKAIVLKKREGKKYLPVKVKE